MSNEAVKKEKVDMDPKYITKLTVTLFVTCVIVAVCLGLVNSVTKGPIWEANNKATIEALKAVYEKINTTDFVEMEVPAAVADAASAAGGTVENVYEAKAGSDVVGHAVKIVASGSQGNIEMVVGLDADGAVTGVSIVSNSETSGIGSKVMSNEPLANGTKVLDQFIGKSAADCPLAVGTNVDAIGGATVSSKGVTAGVNGAIAAVGAIG